MKLSFESRSRGESKVNEWQFELSPRDESDLEDTSEPSSDLSEEDYEEESEGESSDMVWEKELLGQGYTKGPDRSSRTISWADHANLSESMMDASNNVSRSKKIKEEADGETLFTIAELQRLRGGQIDWTIAAMPTLGKQCTFDAGLVLETPEEVLEQKRLVESVISDPKDPRVHKGFATPAKVPMNPDLISEIEAIRGPIKSEKFNERVMNRASRGLWDKYRVKEGTDVFDMIHGEGFKINFIPGIEVKQSHFDNVLKIGEAGVAVDKVMLELLELSIVEVIQGPGYCNHPLFALEKPDTDPKEYRVILNASSLTKVTQKIKFKFESLLTFTRLIKRWSWLWHIDLVKAFFLLRVHPDFRKYFAFIHRWQDGRVQYLQMGSLCMGYVDGPRLYQGFTDVMINWLRREHNLGLMSYMDDLSGEKESQLVMRGHEWVDIGQIQANREATLVLRELSLVGPVVHIGKSQAVAQQWLKFLGLLIRTDGEIATKEITISRIAKILKRALFILERVRVSPRKASGLVGAIISCRSVWGAVTFLRTRHLFALVALGIDGWDKERPVSEGCKAEIRWWLIFLDLAKPPIKRQTAQIIPRQVDFQGWSDSSNKAMCGLLRLFTTYREALQRALRPADDSRDRILEVQQTGGIQLNPRWQEYHTLLMSERLIGLDEDESSTARELMPILLIVITAGEKMAGKVVVFYVDNSGVPTILLKGSSRELIHRLALAINNVLARYNIVAYFYWIRRTFNTIADSGSRLEDRADYFWDVAELQFEEWFRERWWPIPEVDMFASRHNAKCSRFFGKNCEVGAEGMEALTAIWPARVWLYMFPPFQLLQETVIRIMSEGTRVMLVTPISRDMPHWRMLLQDSNHFKNIVKGWHYINRQGFKDGTSSKAAFTYKEGKSLEGHKNLMVMLMLDTTSQETQTSIRGGLKFCLRAHFTGDPCEGCKKVKREKGGR